MVMTAAASPKKRPLSDAAAALSLAEDRPTGINTDLTFSSGSYSTLTSAASGGGGVRSWEESGLMGMGSNDWGDSSNGNSGALNKRICLAAPSSLASSSAASTASSSASPPFVRFDHQHRQPSALAAKGPVGEARSSSTNTAAGAKGRVFEQLRATVEHQEPRGVGVKRSSAAYADCTGGDDEDEDEEVCRALQPLALVDPGACPDHKSQRRGAHNSSSEYSAISMSSQYGVLGGRRPPQSSVDAAIDSIIRKHRRMVLEPSAGGGQYVQLQLVPVGPDPLLDQRYLGGGTGSGSSRSDSSEGTGSRGDVASPESPPSGSRGLRAAAVSIATSNSVSASRMASLTDPDFVTQHSSSSLFRGTGAPASAAPNNNAHFYSGEVSHAGWVLDVLDDAPLRNAQAQQHQQQAEGKMRMGDRVEGRICDENSMEVD